MCGVGDVVAQKSEQAKEEMERVAHDIARTKHFALKGLGGALIWSTWYKIADVLSANMCSEMDCLQATAADFIDGQGRNVIR